VNATLSGRPSRRRRAASLEGSVIRVLVAVAATRERALLPALHAAVPMTGSVFEVLRRCLTADELAVSLSEGHADAAVVDDSLPGLSPGILAQSVDAGIPVVLVGGPPGAPRVPGVLQVPAETPAQQVCAVLAAAVRDAPEELRAALVATGAEAHGGGPSNPAGIEPPPAPLARAAQVVAVIGPPKGSVGTTRIAIEIAAAHERRGSSLLVDAVLDEPGVTAMLGLNPARNVSVLAAALPGRDQVRWARALRDELQALDGARTPSAAVLAGTPSAELRARLDPNFLVELVTQAAAPGGFAWVVIDAGAEPPAGTLEGACWRALVEAADRVLLVVLPDIVGLRRALGTLARLGRPAAGRVGIVLNRHRRGEHDDPADLALLFGGVPVVAVVPQDDRACVAALRAQRPVVSLGRGSAAGELRRLADAMRSERPTPTGWRGWRDRWLRRGR